MIRLLLLVLILLPPATAYGQTASPEDIRQGRRIWQGYFTNENDCKNCHGVNGEGGFASSLAGHTLTNEQFLRVTRQGAGRSMPGFVADKNLSDQQVFQVAAYLRSLPKYTGPRPGWRTPILPTYTPAHRTYIEYGCGQCHGPVMLNPRRDAGGLGPDATFEWLTHEVFEHTTSITTVNSRHLRMGNYRKDQVPDAALRDIWKFMMEEQGPVAPVNANLSNGVFTDQGIQYTITVTNGGEAGKGLVAEHIRVILPILRARDPEEETTVIAATAGADYMGTHRDVLSNTNAATFMIPRLGPGERREITITLSGIGAMFGFPRASIRWELPKLRSGEANVYMINQPFGR
jgi:mono/diheme cytochrome c family protein